MSEVGARAVADWKTDDTHEVNIGESGQAQGSFKNPNFPDTVGLNEDWTGSIDSKNIGDASGHFKVEMEGTSVGEFDLAPGESVTSSFSGTGPQSFTLTLKRYVV